jgi:hypothetical protein
MDMDLGSADVTVFPSGERTAAAITVANAVALVEQLAL